MNTPSTFKFTYTELASYYESVLQDGYQLIRCVDYSREKLGLANFDTSSKKTIVNRVDVDYSLKKARRIVEVFNKLNIKGTFFIRLHAPEYNPFSFESYKTLRFIVDSGHEIGYHSEIVDQAAIWNECPEKCLLRDVEILSRMLDVKIDGIASHGGMTGLNNLDFWKERNAAQYGFLYEAYDREKGFDLFHNSFYVSDSEWTRWKCYSNGELVAGDTRNFAEHCKDGHMLVYLLIHPDSYFDNHFYE